MSSSSASSLSAQQRTTLSDFPVRVACSVPSSLNMKPSLWKASFARKYQHSTMPLPWRSQRRLSWTSKVRRVCHQTVPCCHCGVAYLGFCAMLSSPPVHVRKAQPIPTHQIILAMAKNFFHQCQQHTTSFGKWYWLMTFIIDGMRYTRDFGPRQQNG